MECFQVGGPPGKMSEIIGCSAANGIQSFAWQMVSIR